jgi:AmmeMemoRadiSam system protein A
VPDPSADEMTASPVRIGPFATVVERARPPIVRAMAREIAPSGTGPVAAPVLSVPARRALLGWARACLEAAVERRDPPRLEEVSLSCELRAAGAAFVTITEGGELRGCMGRLDESAPVWENVGAAAAMAATRDPRFAPVAERELGDLHLEVSLLGPATDIPDAAAFDPLAHGIIVERGLRRALLLPQVAREQGWGRAETLEAVCWKAGLDPDAWREPGIRLRVFTATVFGEDELAARDSTGESVPA